MTRLGVTCTAETAGRQVGLIGPGQVHPGNGVLPTGFTVLFKLPGAKLTCAVEGTAYLAQTAPDVIRLLQHGRLDVPRLQAARDQS